MFDIGFWELFLISIIALVVLGPERLPVAIRTVSQFIRTAKNMANGVKDELEQELKIQELQQKLKEAEKINLKQLDPELSSSIKNTKQVMQDVTNDINSDLKAVSSQTDNKQINTQASDPSTHVTHEATKSSESVISKNV